MTPDEFKQRLREQGKTITQWSVENGFNARAVYRVLEGIDRGHYGRAHDIAVATGIKPKPANRSAA